MNTLEMIITQIYSTINELMNKKKEEIELTKNLSLLQKLLIELENGINKLKSFQGDLPVSLQEKLKIDLEKYNICFNEIKDTKVLLEKTKNAIQELNEELKVLYNQYNNFNIDWSVVNRLSWQERAQYFDNLAETISKIPAKYSVNVQLGNFSYTIDKRFEKVFRICFNEVKKANEMMKYQSLSKSQKEKYLEQIMNQVSNPGVLEEPKKKVEITFDEVYYNTLASGQKVIYIRKILNKIFSEKIENAVIEELKGKTVKFDKQYIEAFHKAKKNLYKLELEMNAKQIKEEIKIEINQNKKLPENQEKENLTKILSNLFSKFNISKNSQKMKVKFIKKSQSTKKKRAGFLGIGALTLALCLSSHFGVNKEDIKANDVVDKKEINNDFMTNLTIEKKVVPYSYISENCIEEVTKKDSEELESNIQQVEIQQDMDKQLLNEQKLVLKDQKRQQLLQEKEAAKLKKSELEEQNRVIEENPTKVEISNNIVCEQINGSMGNFGFPCDNNLQNHIYQMSQKYGVPFEILMVTIDYESRGSWENGKKSATNDYGLPQINICHAGEVSSIFGWTMEDIQYDAYKATEVQAYLVSRMMAEYGYNLNSFVYEDIFGYYNGGRNWRSKSRCCEYVNQCMIRLEQHFGLGSRGL